ncbi:MAG: class I SAM-dependent methyltransferase [Pseudomonadota bacterium]|nr:class I SAM-dependent methyltransferase [Pseudomonadota bacterium]
MTPAGLARTWPLPALLVWGLAWSGFALLRGFGAPLPLSIATGAVLGVGLSPLGGTPWRRLFIAGGFPLSLAVSGAAAALPAWGWLLPLALLALVYPLNAWGDAPLFPTPERALRGLGVEVPLARTARVLDAGCGLGDGLRELRREYPDVALHGLEWSWPLRVLCAWRCPYARVRRGDIWAADWSAYDLVYAFQRPESMDRAAEKATRELRAGAWLASLEFEAPGFVATRVLACPDGRSLFLYQAPVNVRPAGSAQPRRRR